MTLLAPVILLDPRNTPNFMDPRLQYGRAAGTGFATTFNEIANMVGVPANVPRWNFDIASLEAQGWLIEEAGTNVIQNPRHEGATGTALTIGNMPTRQSYTLNTGGGITIERLADRVLRGMNGAVYRIGGTAAGSTVFLLNYQAPDIAASSGQIWTHSGYYALVAGSTAGVLAMDHQMPSVGGAAVTSTTLLGSLVAGQDPIRRSATVTLDAGSTATRPRLRVSFTGGATPSFDLWIGPVQLEQRTGPSSQILPVVGTTNASSTRSVESFTASLADFSGAGNLVNEGTIVVEYLVTALTGASLLEQHLLTLHDGSMNNRWSVFRNNTTGDTGIRAVSGGSNSGTLTTGFVSVAGTVERAAASWGGAAYDLCVRAQTVFGLTGQTFPVGPLTGLTIGATQANTLQPNASIRKVAIYPRKATPTQLQFLSA